jgi:hypothetical protein
MRLGRGLFVLGVVCLLLCGCNGGSKSSITVVRYPEFYQPELKRIAVLPFANNAQDPAAGTRISERLETALIQNRTYEVFTRAHLKEVLTEQDLAASGIVAADAAQRIGKLGSVQAIICGACDQYGSGTRQEMRTMQVPVWGTNAKGYPVITGYTNQQYLWTRNEAAVQCNVVVIDTVTGRQIAGVNELSHIYSEGSPPSASEWQTRQIAEQNQILRILRAVAVIRTQVKLKGTVLRVATGQYDGKWDWQDRIIPSDGKLVAVVNLPPDAGRNSFKLTIVPKDQRDVMAEQEFVWPEGSGENSYSFDVQPIVDKRGYGAYDVKLYSGPEPCAWYTFQIAKSR